MEQKLMPLFPLLMLCSMLCSNITQHSVRKNNQDKLLKCFYGLIPQLKLLPIG